MADHAPKSRAIVLQATRPTTLRCRPSRPRRSTSRHHPESSSRSPVVASQRKRFHCLSVKRPTGVHPATRLTPRSPFFPGRANERICWPVSTSHRNASPPGRSPGYSAFFPKPSNTSRHRQRFESAYRAATKSALRSHRYRSQAATHRNSIAGRQPVRRGSECFNRPAGRIPNGNHAARVANGQVRTGRSRSNPVDWRFVAAKMRTTLPVEMSTTHTRPSLSPLTTSRPPGAGARQWLLSNGPTRAVSIRPRNYSGEQFGLPYYHVALAGVRRPWRSWLCGSASLRIACGLMHHLDAGPGRNFNTGIRTIGMFQQDYRRQQDGPDRADQ